MPESDQRRLEPDEVLRVMDAAQVIRARRASLGKDALDRDATIREIQIMYEDLGDLVDRDVIERALEEYLSERYAFTPPVRGLSTGLAWAYVRRGMLTRRVLAPVAVVGVLTWGVAAATSAAEERAFQLEVSAVQAEIQTVRSNYDSRLGRLEELLATPSIADLGPEAAQEFGLRTGAAAERLESVDALLAEHFPSGAMETDPTRESVREFQGRLRSAGGLLSEVDGELTAAERPVEARERLVRLGAEAETLLRAIQAAAVEPGVAAAQAGVAAGAQRQADVHDLPGLQSSVDQLRQTLATLEQEYRVEIVGGDWFESVDDPSIRNHYLRVRAVDAAGNVVTVTIRDEEWADWESVRVWGERVPEEVYDRVAADKQDNGIIDDEEFGTKRRGWVTMDRRYPDVGQLTRLNDA